MGQAIAFYLISAVALLAAVTVVWHRHPIYSVLSLLVVLLCLAALFVMLEAYVIAALQVLIYAGAVLVLFLFVVMLLNLAPTPRPHVRPISRSALGLLAAGSVGAWLIRVVGSAPTPPVASPSTRSTVESVGRLLFTTYAIPFELTSFLMLAAIIGAVTLAKQPPTE